MWTLLCLIAEKTRRHPKPTLSSPVPHPLVPGAHARVPPQPGRQPTVPLAANGLCQQKLLPIWLLPSTARGRRKGRKLSQGKSTTLTWWKWEPRRSWCLPKAGRSRRCDCSPATWRLLPSRSTSHTTSHIGIVRLASYLPGQLNFNHLWLLTQQEALPLNSFLYLPALGVLIQIFFFKKNKFEGKGELFILITLLEMERWAF